MSFRELRTKWDPSNPNLFQLSKDQSFGDFLSAFLELVAFQAPKIVAGQTPAKEYREAQPHKSDSWVPF